jgi:putative SOS response-associated peptidase YedK
MCGRFAVTPELQKIAAYFGAVPVALDAVTPSYNVAPTKLVPVVTYAQEMQQRQISLMKWGLVPSWAKDAKIGNKMINSRAETVATKFRKNFAGRRCIIPANGFYEWHVETREPYFIKVTEQELLGFGGIWDSWKTPEGEWLHSFSIITGEPNELVAPIHNRMPVIIEADNFQRWLSPSLPLDDAAAMLKPFPADKMEAWRVSKAVNNPRNDTPENLERLNSL